VHGRILASTTTPSPPLALRLLQHLPALQRLPARLIGIGLRPEHIATSERAGKLGLAA
jgi:hypothetical protein